MFLCFLLTGVCFCCVFVNFHFRVCVFGFFAFPSCAPRCQRCTGRRKAQSRGTDQQSIPPPCIIIWPPHSTITLTQRIKGLSDYTQNYWIGLSQVNYVMAKSVALTQYYCSTRGFDIHHKAPFVFAYSHCARKFWYSVLTIHRVCSILCGPPEVSVSNRDLYRDKLTIFSIPRR
jgi:hypothetical protein